MKKILTAALAVIVTALALTGCNNSETNSGDNNSSAVNNSSTATSSDTNSSEEGTASGKAKTMADAALAFNPDEWSAMIQEVSDPDELEVMVPGIDVGICEDYCFKIDMAGINKHQVLVAKAKSGSENALKTMFENYLESLKSPDAMLYPAGMESVDGAAIGVTNDGYNYLIIHQNGEAVAAAMNG